MGARGPGDRRAAGVTLFVRQLDLADASQRARIDAFVAEAPDSTPFHLPGWSIAVATATRNPARYLIAERPNGALAGVLPLTEMRSLLFGRALVSTGFGVDGGVLGEGAESLADAAWALAQRIGCGDVELRGGAAPPGWSVDDTSYQGFVRDLAADEASQLQAIPRKQRAEVRRSLGLDLEVTVGSELDEHYRVYAESVRNLGTPVFPRRLFREVAARIDSDVLTVRSEGRAVASVLSLYWQGVIYPYWGGGTPAARGLRANDRMYFALMNHARKRGCTRFDFGRSKTETGAAAFKKNWGFDPVPRRYVRRSEGPVREVNPLNPKYTLMVRNWKRLPLPVATMLGPWISRGLG
ncbi:FemAB-related protein, PEP-CTERM system-associated [Sphingomonas gellani]|uniref:FemAB-related protein, PEP-CTERM system-associated n=1 Tax=Sphingomonas gellani TaxID=1166340 RepID=A0A1H7YDT4_9SPHN|nr:FemAB family XrtA/PEP-CTERM system-associated protein [Sphingomonas gellani]SEM43339.1 FemAB-related protein, PEP-CTERM system-associated [Sphingomonas gellani]